MSDTIHGKDLSISDLNQVKFVLTSINDYVTVDLLIFFLGALFQSMILLHCIRLKSCHFVFLLSFGLGVCYRLIFWNVLSLLHDRIITYLHMF